MTTLTLTTQHSTGFKYLRTSANCELYYNWSCNKPYQLLYCRML